LAYDRNSFVGGSDVLSLTLMEIQIWDWYHTYVNRKKIDRVELPLSYAGIGSACDKFKGLKKMEQVMAIPVKPKKTAIDMFNRHRRFKAKKRNK
jgi:hypothetical protein